MGSVVALSGHAALLGGILGGFVVVLAQVLGGVLLWALRALKEWLEDRSFHAQQAQRRAAYRGAARAES